MPVRREPEHHDVRAGAEDAFERAAEHEHLDLGVLEAQPANRVGELDVDSEVVAVELERVAGAQAAINRLMMVTTDIKNTKLLDAFIGVSPPESNRIRGYGEGTTMR